MIKQTKQCSRQHALSLAADIDLPEDAIKSVVERSPNSYESLATALAPVVAELMPWTSGYHCPWSDEATCDVIARECARLGAMRNEGYESALMAIQRGRGMMLYDVLYEMIKPSGRLPRGDVATLWLYASMAALSRLARTVAYPTIWADRFCAACTISVMTVWGGHPEALPLVSFDGPPTQEFRGMRFAL